MDSALIQKYLYPLYFFTTWSVLFVIFHKHLFKHLHLLYITFVVMVCGLYLSFINPRKFVAYIAGEKYTYTGVQKFIIADMIFHIYVFWFILTKYGSYYRGHTNNIIDVRIVNALLVMGVYLLFIKGNIKATYGIQFWEMCVVYAIANILFFLLFIGAQ